MAGGHQHDRKRRQPQVGDLVCFRRSLVDDYVELWHDPSPEHDIELPIRLVPCRSPALVIDRAIASCKIFIEGNTGWVDDCDIEILQSR